MLIPFLIGLLPILVMGPAWVLEIYETEMQWQQTQITLDNTAILMGRNDRELMNDVHQSENRLRELHQLFHKAQSCSLIPATASACQLTARNIQLLIKALILKTNEVAQTKWMRGGTNARANLFKNKIPFTLSRSVLWPKRLGKCPVCRLGLNWSETIGTLQSELKSTLYPDLGVRVSALQVQKGEWNYRLWTR